MTTPLTPSPASVVSDHLAAIEGAITSLDVGHGHIVDAICRLSHALEVTRTLGGRVYVCGNGGSCANASHLVLHLREVGVKAFDLMADAPWASAVSNDYGYHEVFARTLGILEAGPGDMLVVISGSGQSRNILDALDWAVTHGVARWGLLGMDGGAALKRCNGAVLVGSDDYGVIEDVHGLCIHALKKVLTIPGT